MQEQKASHTVLSHLRANFWLLVLTLVICCTLYPAAVWVVGQVCFHDSAQGSLLDANGQSTSDPSKAVGSKLIAQSFNSAWFFQSRPSAVSYAANASGASNYAASNPKLRGRVAAQLGPIVRYSEAYTKGHPKPDGGDPNPQDDIKAWFKAQTDAKRDLFTEWANNNSSIAQAWATGGWVVGSTSVKDYILQWAKDHPDVVAAWKNDNPNVKTDPGADCARVLLFQELRKGAFRHVADRRGARRHNDAHRRLGQGPRRRGKEVEGGEPQGGGRAQGRRPSRLLLQRLHEEPQGLAAARSRGVGGCK